jgi:hypothetical protein
MTQGKKIKNIVGLVFSWIFSLLFGFSGLGALISGEIIPALILFIMTAIIIPPISNLIKEKTKVKLPTLIKIIIIVVGFILVVITMDTSSSLVNDLENTSSNISQEMKYSEKNSSLQANKSVIKIENATTEGEFNEKNTSTLNDNKLSEYLNLIKSLINLSEQKAEITNKYLDDEGYYKYADLSIDELNKLKYLETSVQNELLTYFSSMSETDEDYEYVLTSLKTSEDSLEKINNVLAIISIKDISQNLEEYRDKNETIKIKGILGYSFEIDYFLEDSEGYYILINEKTCIGINRNPKIGQIYTFEGKLRVNSYEYYRLFCGDTIDTTHTYR